MIASFPWYDLPSVRWANDALWGAMYPGCEALDRTTPFERQWRSPDLIVSQACGLDLFLNDAPIEPLLAPVFMLTDCPAGHYFSYLVGRPGNGVAAVNSLSSRSGCSSLLERTSPSALLLTGSHYASIQAVRAGAADFASIDAVIWHLLVRDEPSHLEGVDRVDRSASWRAPPFVIRRNKTSDVGSRLVRAMSDPSVDSARRALLLDDVVPVGRDDYRDALEEYERVRARIPEIRHVYCPS